MSETIEAPVTEATPDITTDTAPSTPNTGEQGEQVLVEDGEQSASQPATQDDKKPVPAWMQRKIDKLTFERREAERQYQKEREEAENLRKALASARGDEPQEEQLTPDQIRQQERQRYEKQTAEAAAVQKFNDQSNQIAKAVASTHGEAAVARASQLLVDQAGLDFNNPAHRELISDISELPNAGDVYYALAHDPDTASSIIDASPRRQFALLSQFAEKVGKPAGQAAAPASPGISKAPPPVSAPSGAAARGKRSIYDPNLSPAEFDRLWKAGVRS